MPTIVYAILSFFAAIAVHLAADFGKVIDHSKRWRSLIWIAIMLPSTFLFYKAANGGGFWPLILVCTMQLAAYDLLFSGVYNVFRNEPFWFLGSDDGKMDAITDRFWRWLEGLIGETSMRTFRVVLAAIFILFYITYYAR